MWSPRVDRERTLRWQLSITTIGSEDLDDRMEKNLHKELTLKYGDSFKLIRLKTKE